MKKLFLPLFCLSAIILTGCNSNQTQALNSLKSQLDRVNSVVSSTSTSEVIDVSPNTTYDANSTASSLQSFKATSYENMLREESLRQDILSLNGHLKSCFNKKYKLGKEKTKAISQLTNNINKYLTSLSNTKDGIKNNVKKIQKNLKSSKNLNLDQAESSYISLNNSMNERYAYMSNIYSNLEQIYNLMNCCNNDCLNEQTEQNNEKENNGRSSKNIDTFINSNDQAPQNLTTETQPPVVQTPLNQPLQYPAQNGFYNNGYGNAYYGYNRGIFNPNRNTDTFYPRMRNIDTYRYSPNYYNNFTYNEYYNDTI